MTTLTEAKKEYLEIIYGDKELNPAYLDNLIAFLYKRSHWLEFKLAVRDYCKANGRPCPFTNQPKKAWITCYLNLPSEGKKKLLTENPALLWVTSFDVDALGVDKLKLTPIVKKEECGVAGMSTYCFAIANVLKQINSTTHH